MHRPNQSNTASLRTLASIGPVVDALALVPDDSPIITALAKVLSQANPNQRQTQTNPRQSILAFRGFPPNSHPNLRPLLVLSKADLDILAWIFAVPKHGRKDNVAHRIITSLGAPLNYRTPPPTRRPNLLRNDQPSHASPTLPRVIPRQTASTANPSRNRANMPNLPNNRANANSSNHLILQQLEQQLQGRRHGSTASTATGSNAGGGSNYASSSNGLGQIRLSAAQNRSKQMRDLVHVVLDGYDFGVGENPFNKPMNAPLGTARKYVVFSSMQLSRGNSDPTLMFATPPPIDSKVRPEILGGDVQIHLRCLKVEIEKPKSEWKQAWPFPASCRVNGNMVTLNQAQRYTNGKLAGLDTATNVTPCLRKYKQTPTEVNRITLRRQSSTATPASGQFVLFAQEILVYSTATMINNVHDASRKYWIEYRKAREKKGELSPSASKFEMAQQGVAQFLTDPDGLTVSSMKVSLRCPLALTRINTPVKGKRCQHVQCFDLANFLDYSRMSSKFECPVCNKNTAFPALLVISPYVEHALEKYQDCDEVEIFQDGSMVPVERKQTGVASDDEDEAAADTQANGITHGMSKPAEVVDLTLDSDDEASSPPLADPPSAVRQDEIPSMLRNSISTATQDGDTGGNTSHGREGVIEDSNMQTAGAEPQGSTEVGQVDQEFDFTFRADFGPVPWGDPQFGEELPPIRATQATNGQDNWPVDVIAIDSD